MAGTRPPLNALRTSSRRRTAVVAVVALAAFLWCQLISVALKGAAYPHSEWSEVAMLVRCRAGHTPICASKLQRLANHRKKKAQLSTSGAKKESNARIPALVLPQGRSHWDSSPLAGVTQE